MKPISTSDRGLRRIVGRGHAPRQRRHRRPATREIGHPHRTDRAPRSTHPDGSTRGRPWRPLTVTNFADWRRWFYQLVCQLPQRLRSHHEGEPTHGGRGYHHEGHHLGGTMNMPTAPLVRTSCSVETDNRAVLIDLRVWLPRVYARRTEGSTRPPHQNRSSITGKPAAHSRTYSVPARDGGHIIIRTSPPTTSAPRDFLRESHVTAARRSAAIRSPSWRRETAVPDPGPVVHGSASSSTIPMEEVRGIRRCQGTRRRLSGIALVSYATPRSRVRRRRPPATRWRALGAALATTRHARWLVRVLARSRPWRRCCVGPEEGSAEPCSSRRAVQRQDPDLFIVTAHDPRSISAPANTRRRFTRLAVYSCARRAHTKSLGLIR